MRAVAVSGALWSEEKQTRLQEQLVGSWAEDVWSITCQNNACKPEVQRFFRFAFTSTPLATEFKYAFWYRLNQGDWARPTSRYRLCYALNAFVSWLNQSAPTARSLLERSLDAWVVSLRTWLVETGRYRRSTDKTLDSAQRPVIYPKDDHRVYLFRVLYRTVADAYDDRPEMEKDIWDLRKLGVSLNLSQAMYCLNFTVIIQPWLRTLAKSYFKYNLAIHSVGDCTGKLTALRHFSHFLAQDTPQAGVASLDRALILRYLSFLQGQGFTAGTRNNYILNLRTFLEICAYHFQTPGLTRETLIFDDDLGQRPERGTREVPEEVLTQLRQHLATLPTTLLRMVTVLLEVGLRINELCQLPLDCLICDDKHDWYLRFYQSKVHRELIVPLVEEHVIGTIQSQQQEIREKYGQACPYLFPSPASPAKPYLQGTFGSLLNKWAFSHGIRDRNQQLYRFTAHQFRHSFAMHLINEDVPLEVVSRLLGHRTLEMTQVYARIRDTKLRRDLERVARSRKTVDYQGHTVRGDPRANDPEVQMTRKGVRGQTLGVGGCARLVVLGDCTHANKCLTCPMWLTSTDDLPALKSFYDRAIRLKRRAGVCGNQMVVEQQDRIIPMLALRIKSLEDTPMEGSLCVDEVLAQLHTDLTEAECGLEEAQAAGLVLAARHLERTITEMKMRIAALEVPDDRPHE